MIRPRADEEERGWGPREPLPVFAVLWTTGPDPSRDAPFRVAALRLVEEPAGRPAREESWERRARPFAGGGAGERAGEAATARMAREYGVSGEDLRDAGTPEEAFAALLNLAAGRPLVVPEAAPFRSWAERLAPGRDPGLVVGLDEAALLLLPGRLALEGERLVLALAGADELRARPRAVRPEDLRAALAELVARALGRSEEALGVLAHGLQGAWVRLAPEDPAAARRLALVLSLANAPGPWAAGGELFRGRGALPQARLEAAFARFADLEEAADAARPRWSEEGERRREPLPVRLDEPATLADDDRRRVDEAFQVHLARVLAERTGGALPPYRAGQHDVAREIAAGFGRRELLLLHAPTGTGKTLAYLVPAMLWALRNDVRIGVATYTRALQEQALEREVPLARECLRRAGVEGTVRVALLKGRHNYLCWRALRLQAPQARDGPEEWLAWTALALFAVSDPEGDLDRFPARSPLAVRAGGNWRDALHRALVQSRAESGCCSLRGDREACAGEAARRRAERSHVVVTNHALALQRRDLFRHLVFDECEHLHGQAHHAFSHVVPFRALRLALLGLHEPGGGGRHPLSRLRQVAIAESAPGEAVRASIEAQEDALASLDELQRAVFRFKTWREDVRGSRDERDLHSLFREYVEEERPEDLLGAHAALSDALGPLGASLAELSEHLDQLPSRGIHRTRRALDVARKELDELTTGVLAWIPREGGEPAFRPETFHDLETSPTGHDAMAARVLLPHEHLGRSYYPELEGAVLVSATTWLRSGFAASSLYLGLDRAANPAPDEHREPCAVRTFRAPEAFDYGRVLVAVPRDAPSIRHGGKRAFLDYVARFVGYLGERTRGRMLVLFTNAEDCLATGRRLERFFGERRIPLWYQRMEGAAKEELSGLFRANVDSVLLGLDTFWYGADFPGETLEYLVVVRLPYGVPDRYHHAQCAALGTAEQRRAVYMPRALAKLRQGFGRLMRRESDRGCVFVLDVRATDPRHRAFLEELPLRRPEAPDEGAALVRGDTDRCVREALAHMGMLADVRRRGLEVPFAGWSLDPGGSPRGVRERPLVAEDDVPY